jgi:hypothetical protein
MLSLGAVETISGLAAVPCIVLTVLVSYFFDLAGINSISIKGYGSKITVLVLSVYMGVSMCMK